MPDDKKPTEEIAQGLRSIFDRIGEFFHLFDLSFLVSGASTFAAAAFFYIRAGYSREFPFAQWVGVGAVIIGSYICGLLAFAAGRWLNGKVFRRTLLERRLKEAINIHGLKSPIISLYLGQQPVRAGVWRLYIRMWSEIAQSQSGSVTFQNLSRYWVMAATYDGVGFSLLLWGGVLLLTGCELFVQHTLSARLSIFGALVAWLFALVAFKRAADYYEYQIEDVVASLAAARQKVVP
jgi:hypothetical protein